MRNYLFFAFCWVFISGPNLGWTVPVDLYEKQLVDSLSKVKTPKEKAQLYNDLGFYFSSLDSLKADYYANIALRIAKEHELQEEKASAYKNFGLIQGHLQYQQAAITYYDTALQIYQAIADTAGMIAILNNSGRRYCYLGQCETGIKKYHLAESWLKPNEAYKLAALRINQGICLMECRAYEDCKKLVLATLPIAKKLGDTFLEFRLILLMADANNFLKQYPEAIAAFEAAEKLALKMENPVAYAAVLNDKGSCLVNQGFYEQAYVAFKKSAEHHADEGSLRNDYRIYINLGEVTKKLGLLNESIQYFEKGLKGTEATGDYVILADSYEMAAEAYYLAGKGLAAYEYMDKAKELRDTIFTNEMRHNLKVLTTQYETEKIKQELAASNLKIEQERYRHRLTWLGGISLFTLCGIGYFIYQSRLQRKQLESEKRKIELEYGLLRAQMNPHFVFNSLNSIQGYFADNQFVKANEFLGNFSHLIRRVLDQSVAPAILLSEELITLQLYLDVEKIRLKDKLNYEIVVDKAVELEIIKIPPLILQPFVENAIWHGIAPKIGGGKIRIDVRLSSNENYLEINLEDDGVGLSSKHSKQSKSHESKGIQITRERLGREGEVSILDKKGSDTSGVVVRLKIPIK